MLIDYEKIWLIYGSFGSYANGWKESEVVSLDIATLEKLITAETGLQPQARLSALLKWAGTLPQDADISAIHAIVTKIKQMYGGETRQQQQLLDAVIRLSQQSAYEQQFARVIPGDLLAEAIRRLSRTSLGGQSAQISDDESDASDMDLVPNSPRESQSGSTARVHASSRTSRETRNAERNGNGGSPFAANQRGIRTDIRRLHNRERRHESATGTDRRGRSNRQQAIRLWLSTEETPDSSSSDESPDRSGVEEFFTPSTSPSQPVGPQSTQNPIDGENSSTSTGSQVDSCTPESTAQTGPSTTSHSTSPSIWARTVQALPRPNTDPFRPAGFNGFNISPAGFNRCSMRPQAPSTLNFHFGSSSGMRPSLPPSNTCQSSNAQSVTLFRVGEPSFTFVQPPAAPNTTVFRFGASNTLNLQNVRMNSTGSTFGLNAVPSFSAAPSFSFERNASAQMNRPAGNSMSSFTALPLFTFGSSNTSSSSSQSSVSSNRQQALGTFCNFGANLRSGTGNDRTGPGRSVSSGSNNSFGPSTFSVGPNNTSGQPMFSFGLNSSSNSLYLSPDSSPLVFGSNGTASSAPAPAQHPAVRQASSSSLSGQAAPSETGSGSSQTSGEGNITSTAEATSENLNTDSTDRLTLYPSSTAPQTSSSSVFTFGTTPSTSAEPFTVSSAARGDMIASLDFSYSSRATQNGRRQIRPVARRRMVHFSSPLCNEIRVDTGNGGSSSSANATVPHHSPPRDRSEDTEEHCAICLEVRGFTDHGPPEFLPCSHWLHQQCLSHPGWNGKCPICRFDCVEYRMRRQMPGAWRRL